MLWQDRRISRLCAFRSKFVHTVCAFKLKFPYMCEFNPIYYTPKRKILNHVAEAFKIKLTFTRFCKGTNLSFCCTLFMALYAICSLFISASTIEVQLWHSLIWQLQHAGMIFLSRIQMQPAECILTWKAPSSAAAAVSVEHCLQIDVASLPAAGALASIHVCSNAEHYTETHKHVGPHTLHIAEDVCTLIRRDFRRYHVYLN